MTDKERIAELERINAQLAAAEQALLAKLIYQIKAFPLGHQRHWDKEGNFGMTCPLCQEQDQAHRDILTLLQEPLSEKALRELLLPIQADAEAIANLSCTTCLSFEAQSFKATEIAQQILARLRDLCAEKGPAK